MKPKTFIQELLHFGPLATNFGVIIVDMQDHFLKERGRSTDIPEPLQRMIDRQVEVLRVAREEEHPVFVLRYALAGEVTVQIREVLEGYAKVHPVTKKYNDGFYKTDLGRKVQQECVRKAVVMGVNAPYCVWDTGVSGSMQGIEILSSGQLMADADRPHENLPSNLIRQYGEIGRYFDDYKQLIEVLRQ